MTWGRTGEVVALTEKTLGQSGGLDRTLGRRCVFNTAHGGEVEALSVKILGQSVGFGRILGEVLALTKMTLAHRVANLTQHIGTVR
jgi:hypothetical protein